MFNTDTDTILDTLTPLVGRTVTISRVVRYTELTDEDGDYRCEPVISEVTGELTRVERCASSVRVWLGWSGNQTVIRGTHPIAAGDEWFVTTH